MLSPNMHLNPNLLSEDVEQKATRDGFGTGLVEAGKQDHNVVALCADLTESTRMQAFADKFPERFIEIGVAEQNLVTVATGMAAMGKVPFTASYAAFSPGRNWEQIRTTICLNDQPVKIVGPHAGVSVGPDGATHQMLEDIALMRVLPNMIVIVPTDSIEAHKATLAIAGLPKPAYLRLAREKSPIITTADTPFSLGKAQVFREGSDVSLIACGSMVYQSLVAADMLSKKGIEAEVINCATIKPLDANTILTSVRKTKAVITVEEAQINAGLGGAVAELLVENEPLPMKRIGMQDRFGESGKPDELLEHFGLKGTHIASAAEEVIKRKVRNDTTKS